MWCRANGTRDGLPVARTFRTARHSADGGGFGAHSRTFQDADGSLSVSASETTSNVRAEVSVKPSYGLGDGEIANMLQSAFASANTTSQRTRSLKAR